MTSGTIVVLGAGGLIGGHTCEVLAALGEQVVAYGRPSYYPIARAPNIRWIDGEFTDASAVREALVGARCVIHLLGTSVPAASNASPVDDVLCNLVPTLRFLDLCVEAGVHRFIYVSSGGTVYGPQRSMPILETAPTKPISAYGAGKLAIETFLDVYLSAFGLDYLIMRVSNVFGPRQRSDRPQGIVSTFVRRLLDGAEIQIWGDGSAVRDFVYVGDLVEAIIAATNYNGGWRVFNVGSGVGRSILEVLNDLQAATGLAADVTFMPGRVADIPANVLDVTRARFELDWMPRTSWPSGLAQTIEWMKAWP